MGKSSKDKRDAYYRLAKEQGWRARSAFKLLQLDETFNLFEDVTRVVDLCAAPGSWSQVLSRVLIKGERIGRAAWEDKRHRELLNLRQQQQSQSQLQSQDPSPPSPSSSTSAPAPSPRRNVKIVAIDLQPMSPLEGITCLKADITHPSTIPLLLRALNSPSSPSNPPGGLRQSSSVVDLVLSDGAPDVTGLHDLDIYVQSQLLRAALDLAMRILRPGGKFVAKIFRAGKDVDLLYAQLKVVFDKVVVAKPRSSRASSVEAFVVCEGFKGVEGGLDWGLMGRGGREKGEEGEELGKRTVGEDGVVEVRFGEDEEDDGGVRRDRWIAPFLACGDLSSYDADASHKLPEGHVSLDPVQPPTAPPYKQALEVRKSMGGAYGKTKIGSMGRE